MKFNKPQTKIYIDDDKIPDKEAIKFVPADDSTRGGLYYNVIRPHVYSVYTHGSEVSQRLLHLYYNANLGFMVSIASPRGIYCVNEIIKKRDPR